MKNWIQPGEHLTVPAPAAVTGGSGVLTGAIFGVAQGDAAIGAPVTLVRRGVFALPKVAVQVWTAGVPVYWDAGAGLATTVSTDNILIGAAVEAAANPSATGIVLLDGGIRG